MVIIGHLIKKYQSSWKALTDVGLRVLADENITYEADVILLVERAGQRRAVTPIIKPPRQRHLQLNQEYPATLATLFPDQVPAEAPRDAEPEHEAPSNVTAFPTEAARAGAPHTVEEAEQRFFARYGGLVGGGTWSAVQKYLGYRSPKPTTVEEWIEVAAEVRRFGALKTEDVA